MPFSNHYAINASKPLEIDRPFNLTLPLVNALQLADPMRGELHGLLLHSLCFCRLFHLFDDRRVVASA